jgi:hypothetical protein
MVTSITGDLFLSDDPPPGYPVKEKKRKIK